MALSHSHTSLTVSRAAPRALRSWFLGAQGLPRLEAGEASHPTTYIVTRTNRTCQGVGVDVAQCVGLRHRVNRRRGKPERAVVGVLTG